MKRIFVGISLACLLCMPCYAIRSMMFTNINRYIDGSKGIWIIEVIEESGRERGFGQTYDAKIRQTLKTERSKKTMTVCTLSRKLRVGERYLFFGFNRLSEDRGWLDNGNISPVHVPVPFSLTKLKGQSMKEQIAAIMTARSREIEKRVEELTEEKAALEKGLEDQKPLGKRQPKGE